MVVELYQGTYSSADLKGTAERRLGPLGNTQINVAALFESYFATNQNATGGTNLFVVVYQKDNTATVDAPSGCLQGCPAFFTYGAVLDNVSGDATTLEPQYMEELSGEALLVIYPSGSGKIGVRRSVRH
jgi:hypothetical protein